MRIECSAVLAQKLGAKPRTEQKINEDKTIILVDNHGGKWEWELIPMDNDKKWWQMYTINNG